MVMEFRNVILIIISFYDNFANLASKDWHLNLVVDITAFWGIPTGM